MEKTEIFKKVQNVIYGICKEYSSCTISEEDIAQNSELNADLQLNSLDMVELVVKLEQDFCFIFPDQEVEDWKTVNDIINSIQKNL